MPGAPQVLELQLALAELLGPCFRHKTRWPKPFEPEGAGGGTGEMDSSPEPLELGAGLSGAGPGSLAQKVGEPLGLPRGSLAQEVRRSAGMPILAESEAEMSSSAPLEPGASRAGIPTRPRGCREKVAKGRAEVVERSWGGPGRSP